jgi:hypothetical protein
MISQTNEECNFRAAIECGPPSRDSVDVYGSQLSSAGVSEFVADMDCAPEALLKLAVFDTRFYVRVRRIDEPD